MTAPQSELNPSPILARVAELAVDLRGKQISSDIEHAAARALVDWYAAAISGGIEAPARIIGETMTADGDVGQSVTIPYGRGVRPRVAALVNGVAAHTTEIDDIYRDGMYHPGAPTIAAALAVAEDLSCSGQELLRAIAIGFEVGCRLAEAIAPSHYRFWHPTATIGAIGAAAAAGDLCGLDANQLAHALASATTLTGGLQQAFRSDAMSKPLHAGRAAETGVFASAAAQRGLTGALDVFDGPAGFAAATSASSDLAGAVARFGSPFAITATTVKNHSCCGHTFAAIDAALELRGDPHVAVDRIRRIEINTYRAATVTAGNPRPVTPFEAKFSLAYCVAAALTLGTARAAAFEPSVLADPLIRDLVERTDVRVGEKYEALAPGRRAASVTVVNEDGDRRTIERLTRRGDPDAPLSDAELSGKFEEFATPVIGVTAPALLG